MDNTLSSKLTLLDLSYTFALSRRFLVMLDLWPKPHISLSRFSQPCLRLIIVMCNLIIYVILPQITNLLRAWGDVKLMVGCFASLNLSTTAMIKLSITRYYGKTLRKLIEAMSNDWMTSKSNCERNTMLNVAKRGRSLSFRCYAMSAGTAVFYVFFNALKFYHNTHHPRELVYRFAYPYNTQKSPNYEITCVLQLFGGLCAAFINSTIDSFVPILLLHICSQLINLRISINNLVNELANKSISSSNFNERLVSIVTRHEDLIRKAKTIDKCYSTALFVHMITATFQLCFETFQLYTKITDKNADTSILKIMYLFFYSSLVVTHLYIYCYSAEMLFDESTKLSYGVYECKWYDLPPKNVKKLMFIMRRSTIPLRLTAGKFGTFSMEMFGTTLKTSMGYLSVLLTLKD